MTDLKASVWQPAGFIGRPPPQLTRPMLQDQGQEAPRFPTKWVSVLSSAGVAITGYLTWVGPSTVVAYPSSWHSFTTSPATDSPVTVLQARFFNAPVLCPSTGSCETVLSSDYATVFGLPLSLLGKYSSAGRCASQSFGKTIQVVTFTGLQVCLAMQQWRSCQPGRLSVAGHMLTGSCDLYCWQVALYLPAAAVISCEHPQPCTCCHFASITDAFS